MAEIIKSLAITSLFPETVTSVDAFAYVVRRLSDYRFDMVEYYTPPGEDDRVAKLLQAFDFPSVFIAVLPLKAAGYSLCAAEEDERQKAVEVLKGCIDRAHHAGACRIMINSGSIPADAALLERCANNYVRSVLEASRYIETIGSDLLIELEPGDSHVQSYQLLGPTPRVLETTRRILQQTSRYTLAMDTAHIREEGEDVGQVLRETKPYCNHIHLCNCLMDDPASPFYGDKHVDFDLPGACFSYRDFRRMFGELRELYASERCTVTLEITCRADDNFAWFDQVVRRCGWLFE